MMPSGAHYMLARGVSVHKPCSLALNLAVITSLTVRGISVPGPGEHPLWGLRIAGWRQVPCIRGGLCCGDGPLVHVFQEQLLPAQSRDPF